MTGTYPVIRYYIYSLPKGLHKSLGRTKTIQSNMSGKSIPAVASALLILLFLYTAASKLAGIEAFTSFMVEVGFNRFWSVAFAWIVPLSEMGVVILLFFQNTRLAGLYASFLFMLVFTVYTGYMLMFVPDRPCSCGGVIASLTWPQHLIFNVFFLTLSLIAVWLQKKQATVGNK
jgi:putative oxidoreductase